LWNRLSQHRGSVRSGGGNHRGSIFRLIVGAALISRDSHEFPNWGSGSTAPPLIRDDEVPLEREVSRVIGSMPFLWVAVDDQPGQENARGYIERNSIALLSNHQKPALDPPSALWLGRHCNRERVRSSGLWNSNHVDERYDPDFINQFAALVSKMEHAA
jgi:hypothetical protein